MFRSIKKNLTKGISKGTSKAMCFILLSCHLNGAQLHEHEFVPMNLTLKEVKYYHTMMDRHSDTQFIYVSRIF